MGIPRHASATNVIAGILFALAAVCELGGVALIVRGIRAAKKQLDRPIVRVVDGSSAGTNYNLPPRENSDPAERLLLEAMEKQAMAVALLVVGIVGGTVANFLTLG